MGSLRNVACQAPSAKKPPRPVSHNSVRFLIVPHTVLTRANWARRFPTGRLQQQMPYG